MLVFFSIYHLLHKVCQKNEPNANSAVSVWKLMHSSVFTVNKCCLEARALSHTLKSNTRVMAVTGAGGIKGWYFLVRPLYRAASEE